MTRVLIACIGNILRGDDGFGVSVAEELARRSLPTGVDLIETGIGGMSIVQQLMDGYDAMVVVDAVDAGASPGTVFVLDPQVPDPSSLSIDEWRQQFSNLHLAEPSRILLFARAAGVLPARVILVGCQPERMDEYEPTLSPTVQRAVPVAAARALELAMSMLASPRSASLSKRRTHPSPPSPCRAPAPVRVEQPNRLD
jgi:hydrogenase maturation protease